MELPGPKQLWAELLRRRVVRVVAYYVVAAWVLAQAFDLLLDAFDASQYMRFVIAGLVVGLPVATVLAWMFDVTPTGIERTRPLPVPAANLPDDSVAVLSFANLSNDPENEYFSDGLAEEIRNQLARVDGLRVAARSSSFAFKGRHEDVREIGRQLNVAWILEGGVRRHLDTVRIDVQLVNAADGYHAWSQTFERRFDDIFKLQSEVACAVIAAVRPRAATQQPALDSTTQSFDAYNLYLLGRHYFHKRTEAALRRAMDCFREAIERDPNYALAYSGLADAYSLASSGYYGELLVKESIDTALAAATRALELAPELAEAHASLGLIRRNQGHYAAAEQALERAIELNPNYTMARVWHGLVLTSQGRYVEAAEHMREAFRLDPLSPIINANVGFDALRFGDDAEAEARFAAAIEIEPAFPVPYSGMARLHATRGALEDALQWLDRAIERAPTRSFYLGRRGLILAQLGRIDEAIASVEAASRNAAGQRFHADLMVALRVVTGARTELDTIARHESGSVWTASQRAQALMALDRRPAALEAYAEDPPRPRDAIDDLINDYWVWRLPHIVNYAHLRIAAGDESARAVLLKLQARADETRAEGIVNSDVLYCLASACAVMGDTKRALNLLDEAVKGGWRHAWWARHDWNWAGLANEPRFVELLARGGHASKDV